MSSSRLCVEIIASSKALEGLECEWRQLCARDPHATAFQSYDWVNTWVSVYLGSVDELFVIVIRCNGLCVGIAPFYIRSRSFLAVRRCTLMFLGTGEIEVEESFAEYMAPLADPEFRDGVNDAVASAVIKADNFDDLLFERVRLDLLAPLVKSIDAAGTRLRWSSRALGYCYQMPASLEGALDALSSKQRGSIKRKLRRLRDLEGFSISLATDEMSRSVLFDKLVSLHNLSWQGRGQPGVFTNERFRVFHERLSEKLLENGNLLLFGLCVRQKTVAVIYGICDQGACRYYQSGIDLTAEPALSLGILSHFMAADAAGQTGRQTYDLLLSGGTSYKSRIAKPASELWTIRGKGALVTQRMTRSLFNTRADSA